MTNDRPKQDVLRALAHERPVRTPFWLGAPKPEVWDGLRAHFGTDDGGVILDALGDNFRGVGAAAYRHPEEREPFDMTEAHPEQVETVADVEELPWPDPALIDTTGLRERCEQVKDFAVMGGSWAPFFHQIGWLIGQESYFVQMHTNPAVVEALTEKIVDFHIAVNERTFSEAADLMDFCFFGNDFGTQRGLFISPDCFRRFILPSIRRLADHARSFGLHVWLHSCGSVRAILPDLIDAGIEALHPVQVSAAGMSLDELGAEFGNDLMFVGGIDVHRLLRLGSPSEVREAVRRAKETLCPGYAVSPSHEAVLPDVPIENIIAMAEEAKA